MQVMDPATDGGGDEAGRATVALLHQGVVLSHQNEETEGGPNGEEVFHLQFIGTIN